VVNVISDATAVERASWLIGSTHIKPFVAKPASWDVTWRSEGKGHGLFAVRPIARGVNVLVERPVLVMDECACGGETGSGHG
jgi:hypothetical protein